MTYTGSTHYKKGCSNQEFNPLDKNLKIHKFS